MRIATFVFSITFVIIFISGILLFPDAPIYQKDQIYLGKYGAIHTQDTFNDYRLWKILSITSFLISFILNFLLIISKSDKEQYLKMDTRD
jgi:hypothetical protein